MNQPASADLPHDSSQRDAGLLLVMLLLTDLVFVLLHGYWLARGSNPLLNIESDRGYAEFFQYIKEMWIVILLVVTTLRSGMMGYLVWAILFVYLLVDDVLMVHEKLGHALAMHLQFPHAMRLRPEDFGELLITAGFGLALLVPLSLCVWKGTSHFCRASIHLALLVLALAGFGVVVDMLHVMSGKGSAIYPILGMIEDSGEMVVMSCVVVYVWLLAADRGVPIDQPVQTIRWSLLQVFRRSISASAPPCNRTGREEP